MKCVRLSLLQLLFIGGVCLFAQPPALGAESDRPALRPPRARSLNVYQRRALRNLRGPEAPTIDSIDLLVVRVSFSDLDFQAPHDSLYFANEIRHVNEYFTGASRGRFIVRCDLYPEVVQLTRSEKYYGEDGVWDERVVEMLMDVVEVTDATIDYSLFDAFAVIHAGAGQETDFNGDSPGQLWSGFIDPEEMTEILADTLGTPGVPTGDTVAGDTVYVDNLMVWPEDASQDGMTFGSLGIYAYQIGLRIGMVPLFDTTPSGYPDSQGIGAFGLMGYGLYNAAGFIPAFPCAFHRYLMGWVAPVDVSSEERITIADINTGGEGDTTLVRIPISATEYFLLANRVHDADFDSTFDFIDVGGDDPIPENVDTLLGAEFDFFLTSSTNPFVYVEGPGGEEVRKVLTGSGLMIWHIDERVITQKLASGRRPEDDPARKGVDLEEADGIQDLDRPGGAHAFGSYYDSFREGGNARFGIDTDPSSANNARVRTGIIIDEISGPAPVMTFTVRFQRPFVEVWADMAGGATDLSPVPVDLDGMNGEELVVPAGEGRLYVVAAAGEGGWDGSVETLVYVPGVTWAASPVFADMTGDGAPEIFITSTEYSLYAFTASGEAYPIDDDVSPGVVFVSDTLSSAPMACEVDGDQYPEVILLAQKGESIWMYVVGSSIDLPGTDWHSISPEVSSLRLGDGILASHTCRGTAVEITRDEHEGFFYIAGYPDAHEIILVANFIPLFTKGLPALHIRPDFFVVPIGTIARQSYLFTPASGDIDGNGSDEMVCAVPGVGLIYYSPRFNSVHDRSLRGVRPSPPALADIGRDGVLETIVRDETHLYICTGFGTLWNEWPVGLPEAVTASEGSNPPPPPVAGDLDGDGRGEVLFTAGGDLHAYEADGIPVDGWPLPGAGDGSGSPALLRGVDEDLYVFSASSPARVEGTGITGPFSGTPRTSLLRYHIGVPYSHDQSWPFYRRDAGGSGRQAPSSHQGGASTFVDAHSFICYPNPASAGTVTVRLVINGAAEVRVRILTVEGEAVIDRERNHSWAEGSSVPFEEEISTDSMSSGVYICHIDVEGGGRSWSGARKFAVVR
jgi:M6 family metalloprotease-like protein